MRIQEKFEFYFLSLTFVLLGLAIQTAKFGNSDFSDIFELIGWLCLLVSGLASLSRMEWIPCGFRAAHEKEKREKFHQAAIESRSQGQTVVFDEESSKELPISEFINDVASGISFASTQLAKIEKRNLLKYSIHKYGFLAGLIALFLSRGQEPIFKLCLAIFK